MLERRTLLAGLAALPAAGLPIGVAAAVAAEVPTTRGVKAAPLAFDPAAFVADLKASGHEVIAYRAVPYGGEPAGPPSYLIRPPKGRGFGSAYTAVMAKWWGAIEACPDHVERVAAYVFEQDRRAA